VNTRLILCDHLFDILVILSCFFVFFLLCSGHILTLTTLTLTTLILTLALTTLILTLALTTLIFHTHPN
jgi:hypothetical protein